MDITKEQILEIASRALDFNSWRKEVGELGLTERFVSTHPLLSSTVYDILDELEVEDLDKRLEWCNFREFDIEDVFQLGTLDFRVLQCDRCDRDIVAIDPNSGWATCNLHSSDECLEVSVPELALVGLLCAHCLSELGRFFR